MDGFLRALSAAPGVLRAKGFVLVDGAWQLLQHVPGETSLVPCEAAAAGQIVVIGSNVDVEGLLRYLE